jgi:DNA polymerase-3 subunit beta
MVSLDPKEFPDLPFGGDGAGNNAAERLRLTGALLGGMIDRTIFSVSTDETRFSLGGVLFEIPKAGEVRMIATDGHRLAMVARSVAGAEPIAPVILPRKGLAELRRVLDSLGEEEVDVLLSQKELRLHGKAVELFVRALEGEFPDYRQVIPKDVTCQARLARDEILSAVRRVSLVASERSRGVKLQFDRGRLEVSANSPDLGEASEELEAAYTGNPITVGFNARYLLDVLSVHGEGETIEFGLTDAVGPGTLRGDDDPDYTYVIMPMRL